MKDEEEQEAHDIVGPELRMSSPENQVVGKDCTRARVGDMRWEWQVPTLCNLLGYKQAWNVI